MCAESRAIAKEHTLDTDVAVQASSNDGSNHGKGVAGGLDAVLANSEVAGVDGVLALVTVDEETVEHVADVDESLGSPHGSQEVLGTLHLGHELGEDHGATVGKHSLHSTADSAGEGSSAGQTTRSHHRRKDAVDGDDRRAITDGGTGGLRRTGIIGGRVSGAAHGDEHASQVEPHCDVGQPTEFLQSTDLAEDEASQGPDQAADDVAELELGGLRQSLAVGDNDQTDIQEQLNALQNVKEVAHPWAVHSESHVSEATQRELVRVETKEGIPEEVS